MQPGPIAPDEVDDFTAAVMAAFHATADEERLAESRSIHEHGRELVVRDGGRIVATTAIAALELTVPGGAVPIAGVTAVGVLATHRRRGLATALMRAQLDGLRDGGEAVAALWASEAAIYGRFGYGRAASCARLRLRSHRATLRPELRRAGMRPELRLDLDSVLDDLRAVHDAARPGRVGMLTRPPGRWAMRLRDRPADRAGANALRALVVRAGDGTPEGYALYAVRPDHDHDDHHVIVREALAATTRAHHAVWEHLLGLDLVRRLSWDLAPADDELAWSLIDPRALEVTLEDSLWVRLVDLDRALAGRRYARALDVVLDVEDPFCTHNTGRHRLSVAADGTATCDATTDPADLRLATDVLASVYLGGPSLRALADAGRVQERTAGAVDAVTAAFRGTREPWCPDIF